MGADRCPLIEVGRLYHSFGAGIVRRPKMRKDSFFCSQISGRSSFSNSRRVRSYICISESVRSLSHRQNEARRYIAAGGTIVGYGKRLTERQDAEIAVYNRVKADIEKARKTMSESDFMTYWEKRNDELRNLGIKTVGLSDE